MRQFTVAALLLLSALIVPPSAAAQDADANAEASLMFRTGLALFEEGNVEGALIQFRAAFDRVNNPAVLYNIGSCHRTLGAPVQAVEAWERYLSEAEPIADERRAEVNGWLEEQRARIGQVIVESNIEGARVTLDGVMVGTTPLEAPLRLAIGAYRLSVEAAGYQGPTVEVTVAGLSEQTVELLLERMVEALGSLRILSDVPDVEVLLDGEVIGRTPMADSTVPVNPGPRVIEARRPGYRAFRRSVTIERAQELDVTIEMPIDPATPDELMGQVRLALPDAPTTVRVDGVEMPHRSGPMRLPIGPHALRVEVEERQAYLETLAIEGGQTMDLRPQLLWTDDARARRLSGSDSQRVAGVSIGVTAGVLVATGAALLIYYEVETAEVLPATEAAYLACRPGSGMACPIETAEMAARYESQQGLQRNMHFVTGFMIGVGVATVAVGMGLALFTTSDSEVDRSASAALRVGPGGLTLEGTF